MSKPCWPVQHLIAWILCFLAQTRVISSHEIIGSRYQALRQLLKEVNQNPTRNLQLSPSLSSRNGCTGVATAPGEYLLKSSSPSALFCTLQIEAPENHNIQVEVIRAPQQCNKRSYFLTVQSGRRAALPQPECLPSGKTVLVPGNFGQLIFRMAENDFATVQLRFLPSDIVCNGVVEVAHAFNHEMELVSQNNRICQLTLIGPSLISLSDDIQSLCEFENGTGNNFQMTMDAFGQWGDTETPEFSINVCGDKNQKRYLFHCQRVVIRYRNAGLRAQPVQLQAAPFYSISNENAATIVKKVCFT